MRLAPPTRFTLPYPSQYGFWPHRLEAEGLLICWVMVDAAGLVRF